MLMVLIQLQLVGQMGNKLSHSSVALYAQCSYCYYLKYIQKIRPVKLKSALHFGKCIDDAFNLLLLTRDLHRAKSSFIATWGDLKNTPMDFRKNEGDREICEYFFDKKVSDKDLAWTTLYHKGLLFIDTYYKKVLPKIKEVISVQERFSFGNDDGDEIFGFIDLVVRWEDGKIYLLDNKTSSFEYSKEDARNSPQLSLYHYVIGEKYKLDGIGFIVLDKNINKQRIRKCKECGAVNTSTHKTCNEMKPKRCGGEFDVTINPIVDVNYIFDNIDPVVQDKVIQMFDDANNGINAGLYTTAHNPKFGKFGPCDYYRYYEGSPDFYKKESK